MREIKQQTIYLFLLTLVCLSLTSFKSSIDSPEEPVPFKSLTFYIAEIKDQRAIKAVESAVLRKFIEDNLPKNPSLKPIVIDIKELTTTETPGKAGMIDGIIKLNLSFSLQKQFENQHLLNYTVGMRYSRLASNNGAVEKNLKQLNKSALMYFDKWMNSNINTSKVLARGVKIRFENYQEKIEGDTIYYASSRPLTWSDFQSKIRRSNKFAAMVMPNIGYNQEEDIDKGIIYVTITLQTSLAKNDCWLGSSYKDDYMLNHEQRHFDVAKIVTEQFRKKILQATINPDNYEAVINMQYLDSYRDMNKMQKAYDQETAHGLDRAAQQKWNQQIDNLLNEKAIPDA
jgi:hypothetical protein